MFSNIKYLISVHNLAQLPKVKLPEFVVCGRSNVGKSSFLNTVTGKKNLALVGQTPGKTRAINFFEVENRFYLVDLPGFGYAKVQKTEREQWGKNIVQYFELSESITGVFHLIDSRHEPTPLDVKMKEMINFFNVSYFPVLTKVDKLKRSERNRSKNDLHRILGEEAAGNSVFFSSLTGEGKQEIKKIILGKL